MGSPERITQREIAPADKPINGPEHGFFDSTRSFVGGGGEGGSSCAMSTRSHSELPCAQFEYSLRLVWGNGLIGVFALRACRQGVRLKKNINRGFGTSDAFVSLCISRQGVRSTGWLSKTLDSENVRGKRYMKNAKKRTMNFETLEDRRLLAGKVDIQLDGDILKVVGTDQRELVEIQHEISAGGIMANVQQYVTGQGWRTVEQKAFSSSLVNWISVDAGAGNDLVRNHTFKPIVANGGEGNDRLYGGSGNDTLLGGDGRDILIGGGGDDSLFGQADNDVLYGKRGHDVISGGAGLDVIWGGSGSDYLDGGSENDRIYGGNDNDRIYGRDGDDKLYGGLWFEGSSDDGADRIFGGLGNDTLGGGSGADYLDGEGGDDYLLGGSGTNDLLGGDGNDLLITGQHNSRLWGQNGRDTLYAGAGDDLLVGGDGTDYLHGRDGNDTLLGEGGDDYLYGEGGDDSLYGGDGRDYFWGGLGRDYFNGGAGIDILKDWYWERTEGIEHS